MGERLPEEAGYRRFGDNQVYKDARLNIEDLQNFVEVAEAGGISPAAQRLGVAKSIVSRRLVRLETELGVQLLARTTRGAALTEAGAAFREYANRILAELDAARETILPNGALRGRFRIAAPVSLGPAYFGPVLAQMARNHPHLSIHTSYSDRIVDLIGEGFDCAIRVGHLQDSNLKARRVGDIYGKLVASPDYIAAHGVPEAPSDLLAHECLMHGAESWRFMDGDKTVAVHPRGSFKADNPIARVAAAIAGLGLGYLPDCVIDEYLASGALVPVMERYPPQPAGIYIVRAPGQHANPKIRVLTDMLIAHIDRRPEAVA
jgi:DNA-binding transcriptional LysR family regulator